MVVALKYVHGCVPLPQEEETLSQRHSVVGLIILSAFVCFFFCREAVEPCPPTSSRQGSVGGHTSCVLTLLNRMTVTST